MMEQRPGRCEVNTGFAQWAPSDLQGFGLEAFYALKNGPELCGSRQCFETDIKSCIGRSMPDEIACSEMPSMVFNAADG